jgi:hypothetical protein
MNRIESGLLAAMLTVSCTHKVVPTAATGAPKVAQPSSATSAPPSGSTPPVASAAPAVVQDPAPPDPPAATRPRHYVRFGALQSTGGTVANAKRVQAGTGSVLRQCYAKGLVEVPDLQVTLYVTVEVGPRGEPIHVEVVGELPPAADAPMRSCIAWRVKAAWFDAPQGNNGRATITFPVTFFLQPPSSGEFD